MNYLAPDVVALGNHEFDYGLPHLASYASNANKNLNITYKKLLDAGKARIVGTSAQEVLEEYLRNHQNVKARVEGRLEYRVS